jgi:hypothetical protein
MDEITRELQAKLDAAVAHTAGAAYASAQRVLSDGVAAARAASADSLDPVLERSQARAGGCARAASLQWRQRMRDAVAFIHSVR